MPLVERFNPLDERWGHASLVSGGEYLHVETPRFDFVIPGSEIREVRVCRMVNEFARGYEVFHVLIHGNDAFVLAPFLKGALGAIEELRMMNPNTSFRDYRVGRLPIFARHGSLLERALFAIPATSIFTFEQLEKFEMTIASDEIPDYSRLDVWGSDRP
ncbi:hypothetical protein [Roseibium sp. RKSG952]|uniref:hypothetical protein n=1 Tax=Roseibium sp. RKSG952 TaxID=2529384 RepID=UPI0012BB8C71|nr:hypothetical protein [Roseibium sp. RKSG952]MTH95978.1 hypothetical protein [Roseibium sp. RKSG952]